MVSQRGEALESRLVDQAFINDHSSNEAIKEFSAKLENKRLRYVLRKVQ
jgi:hypothetical protein